MDYNDLPICYIKECLLNVCVYCTSDLDRITPNNQQCERSVWVEWDVKNVD